MDPQAHNGLQKTPWTESSPCHDEGSLVRISSSALLKQVRGGFSTPAFLSSLLSCTLIGCRSDNRELAHRVSLTSGIGATRKDSGKCRHTALSRAWPKNKGGPWSEQSR